MVGRARVYHDAFRGFCLEVATCPEAAEALYLRSPWRLLPPLVMHWLVEVSRVGDTVLDLFGDTGTTGCAALKHRRDAVLIELNPDYVRLAQRRILAEWARTPQREQDGTATWSLSLLQKALRQAPDGLPRVSTFTIWRTLHEAGLSWQKSRTWCETGVAMRPRKHGVVRVSDPDALAKKS